MRREAAEGQPHYTYAHEDGTVTLHAKAECSNLSGPVKLTASIVDILWQAESDTNTTGQNGVMWCQNCAVKEVRDA